MSKLIVKDDHLLILAVCCGEHIKKLKAIFVQSHHLHKEPAFKK